MSSIDALPLPDAPQRKPMAKAVRVNLFEREVRERLSQSALELLLDAAQLLSEGKRAPLSVGPAGNLFFGSSMLTIRLEQVNEAIREPCDEATGRRVADLLREDPRLERHLRRVAESEANRLAGRRIRMTHCETQVRVHSTTIYLDIDFEGTTP